MDKDWLVKNCGTKFPLIFESNEYSSQVQSSPTSPSINLQKKKKKSISSKKKERFVRRKKIYVYLSDNLRLNEENFTSINNRLIYDKLMNPRFLFFVKIPFPFDPFPPSSPAIR